MPLLTGKTVPVIEYTLVVGAAAGAVMIGRQIAANATVRRRVGTTGLVLVLGGGAVVVALALGQDAITAIPYVKEQREAVRPTKLLAQFARATHGRYDDTVVLTDVEQLPELLPVFVFNVWNAHYANPASEFDDRARFLERLSSEDDPAVFAAALARNRYDTRGVDRVPHHQRRHVHATRSSTTPSRGRDRSASSTSRPTSSTTRTSAGSTAPS